MNERIKERRKSLKLTQLDVGKAVGVSKATVSMWESGDTAPKGINTYKLAATLRVSVGWLISGKEDTPLPNPGMFKGLTNTSQGPFIQGRVPLISMVQAGNFCESIDLFQPGDAEEWIACPANHSDQSYALKVQGESMLPRFTEGEIIIVDPNVSPDAGKFVIAKRASDQKTTFKQLMKDDEDFYLKALNPDWGDRYIRMSEDWNVCGVVICKIDIL